MTRRARQPIFAAVPLSLLLILAMTSQAMAAISWTSPVVLRAHGTVQVTDADFSGSRASVVWQEPAFEIDQVRIKTSTDGGATWSANTRFGDAANAATDICGSNVHVVFERHTGPDETQVVWATRDLSGPDLYAVTTVTSGTDFRIEPDVACANGRVFVSWLERDSGETFRLLVSHARPSDGMFSPPQDLGATHEWYPSGIALAASGDMVHALLVRQNGDLRFTRWSIGAGPAFPVTALANQLIIAGSGERDSSVPTIAAEGDTVAIAWQRCSGTYAKVSNDDGSSWGPTRRILHFGCDVADVSSGPNALAIRGDRIALTYSTAGIPNFHRTSLARTTNGFASSRRDTLGDHEEHFAGFVTIGGSTKVADAFDNPNQSRVKFRRQN